MKADPLFALLKRRGFLWPTAEIYGGVQGLYDYGPLGAALKRRVEDAWAAWFLGLSDDYYRIDPAEILPEAALRASGHLENFVDPAVTCGNCHSRFRADTLLEKYRPDGIDGLSLEAIGALITEHRVHCPTCGQATLSVPQPFNLMFELSLGATARERGYLRPETAQSAYLAFARMRDVGRRAMPLGIAIVGRAYRNEIAPRQVLFRLRAFTQAELQIFFDPMSIPASWSDVGSEVLPVLRVDRRATGAEEPVGVPAHELVTTGGLPAFYVYHLVQTFRFYTDVLGHPRPRIRLLEKSDTERVFYNRLQFDVEVQLESLGGYRELGALHYRGDYDLTRHGGASGKDLSVRREDGTTFLPHVLELTFGCDRNVWALADAGLVEDGERTLWQLPAPLAPIAVGVFPLLRKEHTAVATEIAQRCRARGLSVELDATGTIGKRYARMDEVGTPFCLTVDGPTIDPAHPDHGTITIRERDSKSQRRMKVDDAIDHVARAIRLALPPPASA